MAPPAGPYSGTTTLALVRFPLFLLSLCFTVLHSFFSFILKVARASAFSFGLVYGTLKLKILKAKAKSHKKAEAKAHH
ncbi:hypothetical protein Lal_00019043 [Lupinus albus]|nr:hypothetical protein Lal_00019043 [Lupinus albus]